MNILNTGTSLNLWWTLGKTTILILLAVNIGWRVWKTYQAYNDDGVKNINSYIVGIIARVVVFILLLMFLFFAFGSGRALKTNPPPDIIEEVQDLPMAPPKEVIAKEAKDAKPEALKRQETSSFKKEADEADAYLKKVLENK